MDVTMGLLAALLWGGTDFLVGLNARAVGVKRAVYFGQALGFLIMTLLLVILPTFLFKALDAALSVWLLGIAAALLTVSGALALSKAFALGKAAIVAPLVTSYGVVTTLLSWASGEHISPTQLGCIVLCVIGVIFSSIHKDNGAPITVHACPSPTPCWPPCCMAPASGCKAATHCRRWGRSPCCGWVTWLDCACCW